MALNTWNYMISNAIHTPPHPLLYNTNNSYIIRRKTMFRRSWTFSFVWLEAENKENWKKKEKKTVMNTHQPREMSFRFFSKPLFHPHTPFLPTPQSLSFPTNSFNMFSITALVVARYWQIARCWQICCNKADTLYLCQLLLYVAHKCTQ